MATTTESTLEGTTPTENPEISLAGHSFCSMGDVLAARRLLHDAESISPLDAICCSPVPSTDDQLWITSPNMWFVPEPPYHPQDRLFSYFVDGMLGKHEYLKWPQAFYNGELHSMAAPANPALFQYPRETEKYGSGPYSLPPSMPLYQGRFSDLTVTWDSLDPFRDFVPATTNGRDGEGTLSPSLARRLSCAFEEARAAATDVANTDIVSEGPHESAHAKMVLTQAYLFHRSRINQLQRALNILSYFPMRFPDVLMWFREFQRLLLDTRGWIYWMDEVRPRLLDPDFNAPFPVLPVRGVFTSSPHLVHELFRVGVPVWFIRNLSSLASNMFVNRVKNFLSPNIYFSSSLSAKAPTYLQGPHIGFHSTAEARMTLRKFSLLNRPIVRSSKEYNPAAGSLASATESSGVLASSILSSVPHLSPTAITSSRGDRDSGVCSMSPDHKSSSHLADTMVDMMAYFGDEYNRCVDDGPVVDPTDEQIDALVRKMRRSRLGDKPDASSGKVNKGGRIEQGAQRPEWAKYCVSVARVDSLIIKTLHTDNTQSQVYFLPPMHLFYAATPTSTITVQKVHNWLRIRDWCFDQIRKRDEVLMTAYEWRVALEGRYCAVPYDHLKVKVNVTPQEINSLPPPGPDFKRRHLDENPKAKRHNGEMVQHRRVASRLEINVRFGLHGGFPPYDPLERVAWGKLSLTAQDLSTPAHSDVIRRVVWELSVANFRLELLGLDRDILPVVYNDPDTTLAARREATICYVWRNEWARPLWENSAECDPLTSPDWTCRVLPVKHLSSVVSLWPGGERFAKWNVNLTKDCSTFEQFEYDVFIFYARKFHSQYGRRPILPLIQPR